MTTPELVSGNANAGSSYVMLCMKLPHLQMTRKRLENHLQQVF